MPRRLVGLVGLVGLVVFAGAAALTTARPASAQGIGAQASALFQRYRTGDTAPVIDRVSQFSERDTDSLIRELRRRVGRWVRDAGNTEQARLDAATFLLDVAAARMERDWLVIRDLVELGCRLVDGLPATNDRLRRWHLAALALAQGAADSRVLLDMRRSAEAPSFAHLAHSRAKFPDEPRFLLAGAVAEGMGVTDLAPPRDREWLADEALREQALIGRVEVSMRNDRRARLKAFAELTTVPAVAGEAHVRAAHLAYQLNDDASALEHLAAVGDARDPFVDYVRHLLTAMVQARRGARAEVEAALRRALEVVPYAQSAVELLSAEWFLNGREGEAHDLIDAYFARRNQAVDPWRVFGYGDFRRFPGLMQELRSELGR